MDDAQGDSRQQEDEQDTGWFVQIADSQPRKRLSSSVIRTPDPSVLITVWRH